MASSSYKKIKSAISAKGSAERQLTSDYADVTSSLLDSELSSKEFDLDIKESDEFFNTLYSGLEVADTLSQGWEEKAKLKSDIATFETSLPEGISPMRIEKKTSLMDVFQKKGKIGDYLYGQDEYFVGDKSYGSMYDVAARGKQIKSLDSVKDLLSGMPGEAFSSDAKITLGDFNPELNFDYSKLHNQNNQSIETSPYKPESYQLLDEEMEAMGMNIPDPD
tara:strand:+ start:2225 stop:2887 length:663 start_codon:yes stop_codon:yes gene_type:complete